MFEIYDVNLSAMGEFRTRELYRLRKQNFHDRLGWEVVCNKDMEFDEYDTLETKYILGVHKGELICSVRFTSLDKPNMITHTFKKCFYDVEIPSEGIESSRFFVDKARAKKALGDKFPLSRILFLSMVNWARHNGFDGIYTIVSRAMLTILKRSGWQYQLLKEASLSDKEKIYLIYLPAGEVDQLQIASGVNLQNNKNSLFTWPMVLSI